MYYIMSNKWTNKPTYTFNDTSPTAIVNQMIYYTDQSWLFNIKRLIWYRININITLKLTRFNKIQQNFLMVSFRYTYY